MNKCLKCGKETKNPKYCSRSCSASVNNLGVRRHGSSNFCLECGTHISSGSYCSVQHQQDHKYNKRLEVWRNTGYVGKNTLKKYLKETYGDQCSVCGIEDWQGKPLVLELEHIDGNHENQNEDNVCLICPNCHSQTDTYKGANRGNGRAWRRERYANGKSY
jgi:5-methylcytosine-specific restriction endonuclease McrA